LDEDFLTCVVEISLHNAKRFRPDAILAATTDLFVSATAELRLTCVSEIASFGVG